MENLTPAQELQRIIPQFVREVSGIAESVLVAKNDPSKWSKKEILGHLVDSSQNNLRRFICGQYDHEPHIVYDQDRWVAINGYQNMRTADLLSLWQLLNERICEVLKTMPEASWQRLCNTGKHGPQLHSLEWLARDYLVHLNHHRAQISVSEGLPL